MTHGARTMATSESGHPRTTNKGNDTRRPLEHLTWALWLICSPGALACGKTPPPVLHDTNVVLISIDTLRADHLGCYGYDRPTSPVLDRIGAGGIIFDDCVAQSTWTVPSHAALLTSRYPTELGIQEYPDPGRIEESFTTLAEVLRANAFETFAFTDAGWVSRRFGFSQGFIEFNEEGGHFARILPRVERWLERDRSGPFFLFLHTYDVHLYDPPPRRARQLVRPYSGTLRSSEVMKNGVQNWNDRELLKRLDEEDLRYIADLYDASIRYVDDTLRDLVKLLVKAGTWEHTILLVTSDHGEQFGEHGRIGHGYSNYEEEIRVPLIIRLPGNSHAGLRIQRPVRSIDIMPTLLDLLDIADTPPDMRGVSLVPLIRGRDFFPPPAFTEKGHAPFQSLRGSRFKVIRDPSTGDCEIYDLLEDPTEQDDLAQTAPPGALLLREALTALVHDLQRPDVEQSSPSLSAEKRRELQALGYLGETLKGGEEEE